MVYAVTHTPEYLSFAVTVPCSFEKHGQMIEPADIRCYLYFSTETRMALEKLVEQEREHKTLAIAEWAAVFIRSHMEQYVSSVHAGNPNRSLLEDWDAAIRRGLKEAFGAALGTFTKVMFNKHAEPSVATLAAFFGMDATNIAPSGGRHKKHVN